VLAAWCLAYAGLGAARIARLARTRSWIVWHEARLAGLRPLLDPAAPVGYLGDRERSLQSVIAFPLTQYAVAPALIENTGDRPRVIGNFLAEAPAAADLERRRLEVERDLGGGLLLLRRRDPR